MPTTEQRPQVRAVEALENVAALDGPGKAIGKTVRNTVGTGALKDALSGTWLGHALHPLLTDLVIGSFVSATVLDVIGGDPDGKAAERLIAVGIASYPATSITGTNDWADTEPADPRVRRVGLAHAAANVAALSLYTASLVQRRKGRTATRQGARVGRLGRARRGRIPGRAHVLRPGSRPQPDRL